MKILILGGEGYIGTRLIDYIKDNINNQVKIVCVDSQDYSGSISKRKDVDYIYAKYQDLPNTFYNEFSDIILLAGQGSVSNSKNILNVIDNNVRNFAWLLEQIDINQKFIYASSSSVYGRTDNLEVDEDFNKTNGYEPYNYYDWSKQTIDQIAELSNKQFYSLRFGTVNGFSRNLRNDVMINSMCYNAKINGEIFVSNNSVNRPILGIDDLCKAIFRIIESGSIEKRGVFNLNSFNASVYEIAKNVSKICNVNCKELDTTRVNEIVNFKLQTKSYDFKIQSNKFEQMFNFTFKDTMETITTTLLENWNNIENFQNRLNDKFICYEIKDKCRVCGAKNTSLLDLETQPLANNYTRFHDTLDYNPYHINAEEKYPLHLYYCQECFHTQLNCVVHPDKLFKNYLYVSGTSQTLKNYFIDFALKTFTNYYNRLNIKDISELKILDIACNDGSQLDAFKAFKTKYPNINIVSVGVDPAENIYNEISSKKTEHDIYCEFFSQNTINKLKSKYGNFDIIIAQNVFAHINYPKDFLKFVKQIMDDKSILYIQTSQKNMILENQFDTVYHEHLSFFNTNSMYLLCQQNTLALNNVYESNIHGTSYIFEITKYIDIDSNTHSILQREKENGLYSKKTYDNYRLNCLKYRNDFTNKIINYKLEHKNIIAFGSTAKSMTVFNFCKLNNNFIDYMIDENPLKQNLYTPGSNIIVRDITMLKELQNDTVILITAWNFYTEIKNKIVDKLKEYNIEISVTLLNINSLEEELVCVI
jgi:nucleoside-diphosphate-sugar epimerase/2-polyprenyl-3-methyl-5-hydroxy-6-metoxy-1,4-benzoquinol methylase